MAGQRSSVSTPLTIRSVGRRARKSMSSSASKVATSSFGMAPSRLAVAVAAASPASTHPSMATTSTGRSRWGQW